MIHNGPAALARQLNAVSRSKLSSHRPRPGPHLCLSRYLATGGNTMDNLTTRLEEIAPSIAASLVDEGYYTTKPLLDRSVVETLREEAIALRTEGRYEQSWSESIQAATGRVVRFDKPGVFAYV